MQVFINSLNPTSVETVQERFRNPFCGFCYYAAASPEERQTVEEQNHFMFRAATTALRSYQHVLMEDGEVEVLLGCEHGSSVLIQVLLLDDAETLTV